MPGYTHLQQAQPVIFGHWLMSFFWKFQRDRSRLHDQAGRTAVLPLGSGALAGNPLGIDREWLAETLQMASISENSLDAVSDRDFVAEFLSWAALVANAPKPPGRGARHLVQPRIWLCPAGRPLQHRIEPHAPEEESRFTGADSRQDRPGAGNLLGLLTMLKGLPSTYNKDLQEDKEALFDTVDTLAVELPIAAGVIETLQVNTARMEAALDSAMLATDLADYLVRRGIPFRESHHLVGRVVRLAESLGVGLDELNVADLQEIHPAFAADAREALAFERSVARANSAGGTAPEALQAQIEKARGLLAD